MNVRFGAVLAALVLWSLPPAAAAHAYVVTTDPVAGSSLAVTPQSVRITFDEPIDAESDAVRLVQGGRIIPCAGGPAIDPDDETTVVCRPSAPLGRGSVDVRWKVVSADSHVVHGGFSFGLGAAAGSTEADRTMWWDPAGRIASIARWFALLGALVFAGGTSIGVACADERDVAQRARRIASVALATCALGTLAMFVVQDAARAGDVRALVASPWGIAWLARAALLLSACVSRARPFVALPLLVTFSFGGHAMEFAGPVRVVAVVADALHVVAAALWLGTVIALAAALPVSLRVVPRVAPFAIAGALLVFASGVVSACLHVRAAHELLDDPYGRYVSLKLVLFFGALALGAVSFAFGRGAATARASSRAIGWEAALAVAIVLVSALLTGTPPPDAAGSFVSLEKGCPSCQNTLPSSRS